MKGNDTRVVVGVIVAMCLVILPLCMATIIPHRSHIASVTVSFDGGETWVKVAEDSILMDTVREWERAGIIAPPEKE